MEFRKDGNDNPVCETAKEIQMYRTIFWTLWEREGGMIWENGIKTCIISYLKKKNFQQFVVIHTVKGFSIVNEAAVDVFLEFSCFFYDPADAGNLIAGSSAFSKSSLYI